MNLVDFCKICGIIFFICMFWYFIYVVFKSNNDYLKSLVGLNKKVVEGFEGDALIRLETDSDSVDSKIKRTLDVLQLSENGKEDQRKLCLSLIEKKQRNVDLMITNLLITEKGLSETSLKSLLTLKEGLDIAKETYDKELEVVEGNGW